MKEEMGKQNTLLFGNIVFPLSSENFWFLVWVVKRLHMHHKNLFLDIKMRVIIQMSL